MERTLVEVRLELAKRYARENALNRVVYEGPGARTGIVAAGVTAHEVLRALADLAPDRELPVRVLAVGMLFPFDEHAIRAFAGGLDEVLVIEEKGPFLERFVRDALYGGPATPPVLGQRDELGAPLVPAYGTVDADAIARIVGERLLDRHELADVRARLDVLARSVERPVHELGAARTPFFCSGCPHNTSMAAPDDAVVGAGIGCHTMVILGGHGRGTLTGLTQMGSEGAQWIGVEPFVETSHFVQNLGDGTFHHSGSLAVRAAVAAGVNVTYKLLVNGYVSMTGGQHVEGQMSVPALTRSLEAEGVRRIVITTEDPARYGRTPLAAIATVRDRRDILAVQRELAAVPGVTVLLHDQACAAELRRERRRGRAEEPATRVLINERVCEGCGDCGEKSSCLSVEPVETEFGRKTRINQTSCNKDYSCLEGDCPSFVTITGGASAGGSDEVQLPRIELPAPESCVGADDVRIRLVGIGGTGVVTVNQVLGMAALLDGLEARGLDQTGLSQKAGPVTSDLHLVAIGGQNGVTPPAGSLDVLLGFDLLEAASAGTLHAADPDRTIAVVSEHVAPTAQMVVDAAASQPDRAAARGAIEQVTRAHDNVYLDAQLIAERILGDATPANVVVLGAAWQRGAIPVSLGAIEEAFRLNGVGVERNLAAFAWGRAWVVDSDGVRSALSAEEDEATPPLDPEAARLIDRVAPQDGTLRAVLCVRVPDLIGWGGLAVATGYAETIARVRAVEAERLDGSSELTEAVARGLHKLIAYKDEYEVARLHIDGLASLPPGAKPTFHLHPPQLRALGMRRKLRLGRWFIPVLRVLAALRRLRGTPFDPFGRTHVRRLERALPGEYLALVDRALGRLTPDTLDLALQIAALPELVRGYEQIKLAGVERFRARAAELTAALEADG
jgi:indolepyruvate ferredoxin oxidoreductase